MDRSTNAIIGRRGHPSSTDFYNSSDGSFYSRTPSPTTNRRRLPCNKYWRTPSQTCISSPAASQNRNKEIHAKPSLSRRTCEKRRRKRKNRRKFEVGDFALGTWEDGSDYLCEIKCKRTVSGERLYGVAWTNYPNDPLSLLSASQLKDFKDESVARADEVLNTNALSLGDIVTICTRDGIIAGETYCASALGKNPVWVVIYRQNEGFKAKEVDKLNVEGKMKLQDPSSFDVKNEALQVFGRGVFRQLLKNDVECNFIAEFKKDETLLIGDHVSFYSKDACEWCVGLICRSFIRGKETYLQVLYEENGKFATSSVPVSDSVCSLKRDPRKRFRNELYQVCEILAQLKLELKEKDSELGELKETMKCSVCWENAKNIVFDPCGHCCCKVCWDRIKEENGKCPFCKKIVGQTQAIFFDI